MKGLRKVARKTKLLMGPSDRAYLQLFYDESNDEVFTVEHFDYRHVQMKFFDNESIVSICNLYSPHSKKEIKQLVDDLLPHAKNQVVLVEEFNEKVAENNCSRYALTLQEFYERFDVNPQKEPTGGNYLSSVGLKMSYELDEIGSPSWKKFFTNMEKAMSARDIEKGNVPRINFEKTKSLRNEIEALFPDKKVEDYAVQYQIDTTFKRYVFEEYHDEIDEYIRIEGDVNQRLFTDPTEAIDYARQSWDDLEDHEKARYYDLNGRFRVFEIEIPGADLYRYVYEFPYFNLDKYYSADMWDYRDYQNSKGFVSKGFKLFETEEQANKFAELVGGKVYNRKYDKDGHILEYAEYLDDGYEVEYSKPFTGSKDYYTDEILSLLEDVVSAEKPKPEFDVQEELEI